MSDTLRVAVDADRCVGSAQCELFCAEVFEVRGGLAHVLVEEPRPQLHEDVRDAADACPAQAVLLT